MHTRLEPLLFAGSQLPAPKQTGLPGGMLQVTVFGIAVHAPLPQEYESHALEPVQLVPSPLFCGWQAPELHKPPYWHWLSVKVATHDVPSPRFVAAQVPLEHEPYWQRESDRDTLLHEVPFATG